MTEPSSPTNSESNAEQSSPVPSQIVGAPLGDSLSVASFIQSQNPVDASSGSVIAGMDYRAHSGPLPSPETLARYKEIDPALPGYIMERAKAEQGHRHLQESRIVEAQVADARLMRVETRRGQFLGAIVALAFLGGAIYLGANGHPVLAGTLGSTTVVSIVAVIVTGRILHGDDSGTEQEEDES
jgi:uncharacterized membrane protein